MNFDNDCSDCNIDDWLFTVDVDYALRGLFNVQIQNLKHHYLVNLQSCYDYQFWSTNCSFASAVYRDFSHRA